MPTRQVLLGCVLALTLGGGAQAQADPRDLTLRLADVGRGYLVGDDSGCGMTLSEGAPPSLARLQREHPQHNCSIELERLWAPPAGTAGPRLVESFAFEFTTANGAEAGFAVGADLAAYSLGLERRSLVAVEPAAPLGDAAARFETDDALVDGLPRRPGTVFVWRTGSVLAILLAGGRAGREAALPLAHRQQARIVAPTPLRLRDTDDREVPLDNPRLGIPVHWLGRRFDPGPGLPPLTLSDSFGPSPQGGGPGWVADIEYRGGVELGLWKPRAWARFKRTRLGRQIWDWPCARAKHLRVEGGRAVVHAGHAQRQKRCGLRRRDRFLAHVYLRDVVVTVNVPICLLCRDQAGRYDSMAGMKAVVRGLKPRVVQG
jgi:hypothetical protein